jgi:hypothetical protein
MTLRESVKIEIDALPEETLFTVRDFLLFQKYRAILEMDDTTYLNSLPVIMDSIKQGTETPVSECVALSEVWHDV